MNDRKPDISALLPDEATVAARRDALTAAAGAGGSPGRPGLRRSRRFRLAAAATTIAVVLIAFGFFAFERDDGAPSVHPAFADAAVKVAEANPRLLITAPGWSVKHAYGFEVDSGSMVFGDGTDHLSFDWYPARYYREYLRDRREVGPLAHSTILGHRATTVHYPERHSEPGTDNETLISPWGGVAVGIRAVVATNREYREILDSLRQVDVDTWLNAMPPEVVQPAALDATIQQMLRGVPLPPNFDRSTLPNASLISDRYRLGTQVTGAVTCGWLEDWVAAARKHDLPAAHEAADGLGSARLWPVLLSMVHEKGWKGEQLPANGNGWASKILDVAREVGRGRLSQGGGIYMGTRDGRYIEEGPGWSVHFGCKSHYRRPIKVPTNGSDLNSTGPVITLKGFGS